MTLTLTLTDPNPNPNPNLGEVGALAVPVGGGQCDGRGVLQIRGHLHQASDAVVRRRRRGARARDHHAPVLARGRVGDGGRRGSPRGTGLWTGAGAGAGGGARGGDDGGGVAPRLGDIGRYREM